MSTDKNHSQNGKSAENGGQSSFTEKHKDGGKQDVATAADWDETVRQAENEKGELKPGKSQSGNSEHNNNGRGGGK